MAGGKPMEVVAGQVLVRFSTSPVGDAGAGGSGAGAPGAGEAGAGAPAEGKSPADVKAERSAVMAAKGAMDRGEVAGTGWTLIDLPPGMKVSEGMAWARTLPGAELVEPSHVLRVNRTPNDPYFSSQWAHLQVNAPSAWQFETGGTANVTVAVIDTGIEAAHGDLSGKLVGTSQFFNPNAGGAQSANQPSTPACNHATRVAGLAAASTDNGMGIAGMSWGAGLISLKVFRDADCLEAAGGCQASGCATSVPSVVNAIAHAQTLHGTAGIGKVVVNMSIGDAVTCPAALQVAVTNAVNAGLLLVASAGNDGDAVMSPANCTGVMPVGATDQANTVASFSSRGTAMAASGIVAPGVNVLTSSIGNSYGTASGTSFAAPIEAGTSALVWSARSLYTADQVKQTLRLAADNIGVSAEIGGAGRLNAFRALRLAARGTLVDFEGDQKAIAFPNPFRPTSDGQVTLTIPVSVQGRDTVVKVYDSGGRLVKEMTVTSWDGTNTAGRKVASGVYTFVVTTDKGGAVGRLTVVR
ncbi:MAG: S8 family serine peptidase [Elusimicrobiota bacterium]